MEGRGRAGVASSAGRAAVTETQPFLGSLSPTLSPARPLETNGS